MTVTITRPEYPTGNSALLMRKIIKLNTRGRTTVEIAEKLGMSQSHASNLRIIGLNVIEEVLSLWQDSYDGPVQVSWIEMKKLRDVDRRAQHLEYNHAFERAKAIWSRRSEKLRQPRSSRKRR